MTKYRYIETINRSDSDCLIHYGLYSLLGKGEWSRAHWHIPKEEYEALAGKFTAENLDTDEWAALANARV